MPLTSSSSSVAVTSGSPSSAIVRAQYSSFDKRGRQLRIVGAPIAPRRHPHGERLGPILVGMLLRVPTRQMADEPAAERLRPVLLAIRLRDRAEQLHPRFAVVEPVGVVHDVAHLVAQVAQDVGAVEPFDVPDLLAMQRREIGMSEIERNADDDGAERHAPFGRQVKTRHDLVMPRCASSARNSSMTGASRVPSIMRPRSRIGAPNRLDSRKPCDEDMGRPGCWSSVCRRPF